MVYCAPIFETHILKTKVIFYVIDAAQCFS